MTVKIKPTVCTTQAVSIKYKKTCDVQNYSFSQFSLSKLLSADSCWDLVPACNLASNSWVNQHSQLGCR